MNWMIEFWKLFFPKFTFGVESRLTAYLDTVLVVFSGTQQIDSLLDNEYTDLSDEINNSGNGYEQMDLELVLGTVVFVGTDSAIEVYIIPSVDGSNYPDWDSDTVTDAQENNKYFRKSMTTTGASGAQRMTAENISMPPGKFKIGLRSRAGVTLNAAGNDLKYSPHGHRSQ